MTAAAAEILAANYFASIGRLDSVAVAERPLALAWLAWLIPLAIIALGVALLVWHWQSWRGTRGQESDASEVTYQRRRFRRRAQTSGMLVLLGAAMAGGQAIAPDEHPSLFVFFWSGVALLALWAMALALTDMLATRAHLGRLMRRQSAERAKLQAELTRKQAERDAKAPKDKS
ncbi:MAG TPA: hypothetical protein VJ783_22260 [Pirellulales bacterium]|nr:hypothetical protein [Pirellulales bacterium]